MSHVDNLNKGKPEKQIIKSLSPDGTVQIFDDNKEDFKESVNRLCKYLVNNNFQDDARLIVFHTDKFITETDKSFRQAAVGNTTDRQVKLSAGLTKIGSGNDVIDTVYKSVKKAVEDTKLTTEQRANDVAKTVDDGLKVLLGLGKEGIFIRAAASRVGR